MPVHVPELPLVPAEHRPQLPEQLRALFCQSAVLARDVLGERAQPLLEVDERAEGELGFEHDARDLGLDDGHRLDEGVADDVLHGVLGGKGPQDGEG